MPARRGLLAPQNTFLDTIAERFDGTHSNFVLGNAQAEDHPVVYCSDGFCELTEFARSQIMSQSAACAFLYGSDTLDQDKQKIKDALDQQEELQTEINLYKRSGSMFVCLLDIVPIKNEKGQVVLFLASHKDVTRERMAIADKSETKRILRNLVIGPDLSLIKRPVLKPPRPDHLDTEPKNDTDKGSDVSDDDLGSKYDKTSRRRSRAVLYTLHGHINRQQNKGKKNPLQQIRKIGVPRSLPEYKVQDVKKSKWIILHCSLFKIGWDWLILLCTFYIAIFVPYYAAFKTSKQVQAERSTLIADIIVEVLFIVDIILNFFTTFVNTGSQVVYEPKVIALHYLKGWFVVDFIAALPFDVLYLTMAFNDLPPIHMLKLARLLRLIRLLQRMETYSQYTAILLGLLMLFFALVAHWFAVLFYVIGKAETDVHGNWSVGWIPEVRERLEIAPNESLPTDILYMSALYFTTSSMTSVGFGNVSANTFYEKLFAVFMMIVGALMHAVIFGNVTAIIQRMYARQANFHARTKDLKDFLKMYRIPKDLKTRMRDFFQTSWALNHGIDPRDILRDFPPELRGDIAVYLYSDILSLNLFSAASIGCKKALALQVKTMFVVPGDSVIHEMDVIHYLYFVCSGSLEILRQGMVVAILGKGDLFGADIKISDDVIKCRCDVKSLTYCDLQCIAVRGIVDIMHLYPSFAVDFSEQIVQELTYNLRSEVEAPETATTIPNRRNSRDKERGGLTPMPSITEADEEQVDRGAWSPELEDSTLIRRVENGSTRAALQSNGPVAEKIRRSTSWKRQNSMGSVGSSNSRPYKSFTPTSSLSPLPDTQSKVESPSTDSCCSECQLDISKAISGVESSVAELKDQVMSLTRDLQLTLKLVQQAQCDCQSSCQQMSPTTHQSEHPCSCDQVSPSKRTSHQPIASRTDEDTEQTQKGDKSKTELSSPLYKPHNIDKLTSPRGLKKRRPLLERTDTQSTYLTDNSRRPSLSLPLLTGSFDVDDSNTKEKESASLLELNTVPNLMDHSPPYEYTSRRPSDIAGIAMARSPMEARTHSFEFPALVGRRNSDNIRLRNNAPFPLSPLLSNHGPVPETQRGNHRGLIQMGYSRTESVEGSCPIIEEAVDETVLCGDVNPFLTDEETHENTNF